MDPISPPLLWTTEDDFLLKNAIEDGASLQSLAKGAVSFSRRYSFSEVRDRWRSILYDPDVSKEVAASMVKLEMAKYKSKKIKTATSTGLKRKSHNIHKHYYAMRKRIHKEASIENDSFAELEANASSSSSNQGDSTFVFDCGNEVQLSDAAKSSHP